MNIRRSKFQFSFDLCTRLYLDNCADRIREQFFSTLNGQIYLFYGKTEEIFDNYWMSLSGISRIIEAEVVT